MIYIKYSSSGRVKILDFYRDTLDIVSLELKINYVEETHSRNFEKAFFLYLRLNNFLLRMSIAKFICA